MSWSGLKKQIEERFAPSLQGRVSLFKTRRRSTRGATLHCGIRIDGKEILSGNSYERPWRETDEPRTKDDHSFFNGDDFNNATDRYLDLTIEEIISSDNLVVRAIGMLDKRLGKRRLRAMDLSGQPELLRRLWQFRCLSENMILQAKEIESEIDFSQRIPNPPSWRRQYARHVASPAVLEDLLQKHKVSLRIPQILRLLKEKAVLERDLSTRVARELFKAYHQAKDVNKFSQYVEYLNRETKLLDDVQYAVGVFELALDSESWIRPVEDWRSSSHNANRQFYSLVRHLLAEYEMPVFMDHAWFSANRTHQGWYKHLAAGKNIRTAPGFPTTVSKKGAHYFLKAPTHYTIDGAIRFGQILAMGGDQILSDTLIETRLGRSFEHDQFWQTVVSFFVKNPMLDLMWAGPIIDYIYHQRFEPVFEVLEDGLVHEGPPLNPHFSMSGRTADSILRLVEEWHGALSNSQNLNLVWSPSGIEGFSFVEGSRDSENKKQWIIRELITSAELLAEGRALKHCVYSYARSCASRRCSIWTLEVQTERSKDKLVTIEIDNQSREIRQVRGYKNRYAVEDETRIIAMWAEKAHLVFAG